MDRRKCLIFLKDKERTETISSLYFDDNMGLYRVRFQNNEEKEYFYKYGDVQVFKPEVLSPEFYCVSYKGNLFSGLTAIYRYKQAGYCYLEKDETCYLIALSDLKVSRSVLENKKASDIFTYLKEISFINPIADDEGERILSKRYKQMDFVNDESILAGYLSEIKYDSYDVPALVIYPFGCNRSQKKAVENALSNKLSIIQGPPGTGKTQTILSIIANLILQKKTVEIVSNNNSAVDNVKEKLEKYGLAFLVASLGSAENKEKFLLSQSGVYPDMSGWKMLNEDIQASESRIIELNSDLEKYFVIQEELQKMKVQMSRLNTEKQHFSDTICDEEILPIKQEITSTRLISLIQDYSVYFQTHEHFSLIRRIRTVFFQKILNWKESAKSGSDILAHLQLQYYRLREEEIQTEISKLDEQIKAFDLSNKIDELSLLSMRLLKSVLFRRFKNKLHRAVFTDEDLWKAPDSVVEEYPVVTSTAFSSCSTLKSQMYDYVIIDESSQCDIATGAFSLASARNAVVVGDVKQLQNVVTKEDIAYSDSVFEKYRLSEAYRYSRMSFLASVCAVFPTAPSVLLCEHYRCQPRIIGFCNEKFYANSLVIMTEDEKQDDEVELFLTAQGNHSREHSNLRQAEVIAQEILPALPSNAGSIGIITPYQKNAKLIRDMISREDIQVDTIHSFQGREMDTIIFATSDDTVTDFSDSPMLINVAVSRAKKHFILVASSNPQPADSNIRDLISYISYNNFKTVQSDIVSVFDLLYEQSTAARVSFLSKHRKVSEYDSENVMFSMLEEILNSSDFHACSFKIVSHYPVRYLFQDRAILTEAEQLYLSRSGTHVDFLIYRAIGKVPVVAIEVDGFHFHKKNTKQHERDLLKDSIFSKYNLPLLRFRTDGSGEYEKIKEFLKQYISNSL